ncbi:MAG: dihydrolipoyl dehydrogenase [Alphaproteobacteria bacterium]|nr:dihydrolipoyl dehydrogenase [Alphaproteobacteria bacterium]MCB9792039.1 dihydrolipoyl dehydrogenase [Alphaproteobacteria bacterium]
METRSYQAIVLGAGTGGYPAAIRLAQLGVKTLIIDKGMWGGVCLNVGCIPSKALITAGKQFQDIQHADVMGINVSGDVSIDMEKLVAWKAKIVKKLTSGVRGLLKSNGAEMMEGVARFDGPGRLIVNTAEGEVAVEAPHIVVATGSRPIEIPGFSYADSRVMDSTKALELDAVPERLVVIGGGYIGLELGGMLAKVGSNVTVVEMADDVLPGFDPDVIKVIRRQLKKDKVTVLTGTRALGWEEGEGCALVRVQTPKGEQTIEADKILVTVGRFPNIENIGLDTLPGLEMDGRFIKIDKQCKTSVAGIYATGDVAGQPMLAHKATHEAEVVAEVIAGHKVFNDAKQVPAVVFTDPEIATAGMQEHEARAAGYELKIGKMPFAASGRAMTTNHTDGFVKVILNAADERVLGVTIVGPHASDLISEASLAIEMDAEALDIGLTIHPHPTLGETVMEAAKHARGEAVHIMN